MLSARLFVPGFCGVFSCDWKLGVRYWERGARQVKLKPLCIEQSAERKALKQGTSKIIFYPMLHALCYFTAEAESL